MHRLEPFGAEPALAAAVSGGADSMALALLARDWATERGGSLTAFVVDHALRPESAAEADLTIQRLRHAGIPAHGLRLAGLGHGAGLAERARDARYGTLANACRDAGILHLLLGHHAADQAETMTMRVLRNSQSAGLAGMAAVRELGDVRLLRPLLAVPPAVLRGFLAGQGVAWIEDPSNRDERALRPRLRRRLGPSAAGLACAAIIAGEHRARDEARVAAILAERVTLYPEGYALLTPGRISVPALQALFRTIAGAAYPVAPGAIAELAAEPRPATLGGVRVMRAGRFGRGWLVVREEAAIGAPVPASDTTIWDRRFRLVMHRTSLSGMRFSKLGDDAARFRKLSPLPSAVLRGLPALRCGGVLVAVPHINGALESPPAITTLFAPPNPLAGAIFAPSNSSEL